MKSRRLAREAALQALYLCDAMGDFSSVALATYADHFLRDGYVDDNGDFGVSETVDPLYFEIVEGVVAHRDSIDEAIGLGSKNWSMIRMAIVDRNIIRIAVYEMLLRSDIPVKVSINEALEIAKDFSSHESPIFINGVLDKISEHLGRKTL